MDARHAMADALVRELNVEEHRTAEGSFSDRFMKATDRVLIQLYLNGYLLLPIPEGSPKEPDEAEVIQLYKAA
jgi:hypothetical protein